MKNLVILSALLLFGSNAWAEETYRECLERADKKGSEKLGGFNAIMKECRALEDYIDDKWKLLEEERYQESERVFAERKRQAAERKRQAEWKVVAAEYKRKQAALAAEKRKQELLTQLIERCTGYGFTGENNIATCVQNEAFNDRRLAQQRYEFQAQLVQQAQETQEALEAQLAMNKASEEVTFLQIVMESIAEGIDGALQHELMHRAKN